MFVRKSIFFLLLSSISQCDVINVQKGKQLCSCKVFVPWSYSLNIALPTKMKAIRNNVNSISKSDCCEDNGTGFHFIAVFIEMSNLMSLELSVCQKMIWLVDKSGVHTKWTITTEWLTLYSTYQRNIIIHGSKEIDINNWFILQCRSRHLLWHKEHSKNSAHCYS